MSKKIILKNGKEIYLRLIEKDDLEGIWNILRNKIDTVIGYEEFQHNRKKERKHGASEIRV